MARIEDKIYMASPVWMQQIMVAAFGWVWFSKRLGGNFPRFVSDIKARDNWEPKQFSQYQLEQFRGILVDAEKSDHYSKIIHNLRLDPRKAVLEDLAKFPLLTKDTLRAHGRSLLTQNPIPSGTEVFKSSGTTGTPTEIYYPLEFHQLVQAFFEARNKNWAGVNYKDRRAMFGARKVCRFDQQKTPFWRLSPRENMAYFSIYHLSPQFLPAYVKYLNAYKPVLIMGYPNALNILARFVLENGLSMPPAKAIITTSETVTPEIRGNLEGAWGCKLFDNYCSVEACMLATQCEYGRYHLSPDFGIFEILRPDNSPCELGETGRAVCTGFHNHLQPLIRYEIGDAVAWSTESQCPCGRHFPIIEGIEGRIEDMCYTRDGRSVLRFDTVFKGIGTIREAQIIQESVDCFIIKVVPSEAFNLHDIQVLKDNLRLHVGDVEVDVQCVDEIPRTQAGKFKPVISKVPRI